MDDLEGKVTEDVFVNEHPRIAIVGPMASGKTTLARQLAERLAVPHVDCDGLFWEADWTPAPMDVLRQRVSEALAAEHWVTDGNIGRLRDLQLPRITTLVWLDYPLHTCMRRLLRRHEGLRQHYEEMATTADARHVHVVRLGSPGETRGWVKNLSARPAAPSPAWQSRAR